MSSTEATAGNIVGDWLDSLPQRATNSLSRDAISQLRSAIAAGLERGVETATIAGIAEIRAALREQVPRLVIGPPALDEQALAAVREQAEQVTWHRAEARALAAAKQALSEIAALTGLDGSPTPQAIVDDVRRVLSTAAEPPRGPVLAHVTDDAVPPDQTPEGAASVLVDRWSDRLDPSVRAFVGGEPLAELRHEITALAQRYILRPPSPQRVAILLGKRKIVAIWAEDGSAMLDLRDARGVSRTVAIDLPSCEPRAGETWPADVGPEDLEVALPALRDAMTAWSVLWTGRER